MGIGTTDGLQIGGGEDASSPPLHLLEVGAAAGVAEEEEALQGLDIGAGGDHVHRHGNAELRGGTELLDEGFGFLVAAGLGIVGLVGDLLGEVVPLPKDFADKMNGVLCMRVVFAEDECLRNHGASWKEFGEEGLLECLENRADLGLHHDGTVEILGRIGEILVESLPARGTGFFATPINIVSLLDLATLLGDFRPDAIDLVTDIHTIRHRSLVVVFHHEVLIEETDGLLGGSRGQSDEEGIKVFEHLTPEAVDGPVAFIDNNEIKGIGWNGGIVGHIPRALIG